MITTQSIGQLMIEEDEPGFGQRPWIFEEDRVCHRADEVVEAGIAVSKDPQQLIVADQA